MVWNTIVNAGDKVSSSDHNELVDVIELISGTFWIHSGNTDIHFPSSQLIEWLNNVYQASGTGGTGGSDPSWSGASAYNIFNLRSRIESLFNPSYDTAYHEITYSGGNVTNVDIWDTDSKSVKFFSKEILYSGGNVKTINITDDISSLTLSKELTYDVDGNIISINKVVS